MDVYIGAALFMLTQTGVLLATIVSLRADVKTLKAELADARRDQRKTSKQLSRLRRQLASYNLKIPLIEAHP